MPNLEQGRRVGQIGVGIWGVPAGECSAVKGVITHAASKHRTTYGKVAMAAAKLDAPKDVDLDVTGVSRLRLVVTDANDGNKFDVANWLEPVLRR